jgi:hypothetical protein
MKDALKALCLNATALAQPQRDILRCSPFHSTARNKPITELPGFENAVAELRRDPRIIHQFGDAVDYVALQFVFDFLRSMAEGTSTDSAFAKVWESLEKELAESDRRFVIVTNLKNFVSHDDVIEISANVTIRTRDYEVLSRVLDWSEATIDRTLGEDWSQIAASSYVFLVETRQPKTAQNLALINDLQGAQALTQTLNALRLYKRGSVRTGTIFFVRPEHFSIRVGGISSSGGTTTWHPGTEYSLAASEATNVRELADLLGRVTQIDDRQMRPLHIALNAFASLYAREQFRADDRIVNAITALEAILHMDGELAFRTAFRIAAILGACDDNRVDIFEKMRSFYDTRIRFPESFRRLLRLQPRHHLPQPPPPPQRIA